LIFLQGFLAQSFSDPELDPYWICISLAPGLR
jgi:hypothetical protein